MSWREEAKCRGEDINLFFAAFKGDRQEAGIEFCQDCPVREECLQDALDTPHYEDWGIRGGLGRQRRAVLRRKLAA